MSAQQPQSQVEQAGLSGGRTFVRWQGVEWPALRSVCSVLVAATARQRSVDLALRDNNLKLAISSTFGCERPLSGMQTADATTRAVMNGIALQFYLHGCGTLRAVASPTEPLLVQKAVKSWTPARIAHHWSRRGRHRSSARAHVLASPR